MILFLIYCDKYTIGMFYYYTKMNSISKSLFLTFLNVATRTFHITYMACTPSPLCGSGLGSRRWHF